MIIHEKGRNTCHSVLLVFFLFCFGFFFARADINLGLTAPITIISRQQHGESEKRNWSQEDIFPEDYNSYSGGQTFGFSYWTVSL